MSYQVAIRQNATGEIRMHEIDFTDWGKPDGYTDLFWWTDGNFGCDCNRKASFYNVGIDEPGMDFPCGHEAYSVLYAILPDGKKILIDEVELATKEPA